jgi:hypothetical protein
MDNHNKRSQSETSEDHESVEYIEKQNTKKKKIGDDEKHNESPSFQNLLEFINVPQSYCLNEKYEHTYQHLLKNQSYLESDCDEQLLLAITFLGEVNINSLILVAPTNGN